ncbi:MAG: hypothetical protein QNK37_04885 [Acidobacteriota bacterium]|nr:hypothetical protein [Acidobacteriota bacterium]
MTYSKVLFIGYAVNTAPKRVNGASPATFAGMENGSLDIRARCKLLRKAIDTAWSSLEKENRDGEDLLKVFVVPEFFFRGKNRPYDMAQAARLRKALAQMVKAKKWSDWIFFFGSALTAQAHAGEALVFNSAQVQGGGPEPEPAARIQLNLVGSGDLDTAPILQSDAVDPDVDLPLQDLPSYDQTGIFTWGGVTFGLELSRDHAGRDKRRQLPASLPGASMVQLQIQPSCGFDPKSVATVAMAGGWVFNCDGMSPPGCELLQVGGDDIPVKPDRIVGVDNQDLETSKLLITRSAGKLFLYEPLPLPEPKPAADFTDRFEYHTENDSYVLSFRFRYDRGGKIKETTVAVQETQTGETTEPRALPCAVEMPHSTHPLRANMHVRYTPVTGSERDLLLFVDLACANTGLQGAMHAFCSKVPTR